MSDKMIPGGEEHTRFMESVLPGIGNIRERVLAKFKGNDRGIADGWFIALLISLSITIGKRGGLNDTQLRAVFEMYLNQINEKEGQPPAHIDPRTIIFKD